MLDKSFIINKLIGAGSVGTGLKHEHAAEIFDGEKRVDFFEIHAENYMGAGGPPHHLLRRIRESYPLSVHGVGLSIGGAGPLDRDHLRRLSGLVLAYRPALSSEHLAWSSHDGVFLNDLLPLPYNEGTLAHVCAHIDQVQDSLAMPMLLENPSTYVSFAASTMSEIEFLRALVKRTGCRLLLDVNNVYVSAINHGFDATTYIDAFPIEHVGELHLASFAEDRDSDGARLLIDAHGSPVSDAVWRLYRRALGRGCTAPTLIEWDNDVPDFSVVVKEVERARDVIGSFSHEAHSMVAAHVADHLLARDAMRFGLAFDLRLDQWCVDIAWADRVAGDVGLRGFERAWLTSPIKREPQSAENRPDRCGPCSWRIFSSTALISSRHHSNEGPSMGPRNTSHRSIRPQHTDRRNMDDKGGRNRRWNNHV